MYVSSACPDGWYAENCTEICPKNMYGQLCLEECPSNCNTSCHHIHGCEGIYFYSIDNYLGKISKNYRVHFKTFVFNNFRHFDISIFFVL